MKRRLRSLLPQIACPFCAGSFSAAEDDSGIPCVLHSLPMCSKFEELEPDRFLEAVRKRRQS